MIRDTTATDRMIINNGLSKPIKTAGGLLVVLVLLGLVAAPSVRRWARSETSIDISRVRIAEVRRGDLVREVAVKGRIVAAFHPTLYSPTAGIVSLEVRAGETIKQQLELARVSSPELENRLQQERSSLLSLQADLERQQIQAEQSRMQHQQTIGLLKVELEAARRAMDRAQRTRQLGIVNDVEYEKAQDAIQVAELRLAHARQLADFSTASISFEEQERRSRVERQRLKTEELKRQVTELVIRSPVDGIVSRTHVEEQQAVSANTPLVTVVDLSAFEVEIAVAENQADEIVPGTEAVISCDGKVYPGVVRSISPAVEGSRVQGIVAFTGAVPDGLRQHQRVSTSLVLERRDNVLKVDRGPFLESLGGRQAYVVDDGLAVLRSVEIGALSVSEVEITSGLEPGDQVIISDSGRFDGAATVLLRD